MKDNVFIDQDHRLWVLLQQARDVIFKLRAKELNEFGITNIQAAALFMVQAINGLVTPAEISRWLLREPHSVSVLLTRMERDGMVKKTRDLDKKNLVRVSLTEKGEQDYIYSMKREAIHRIFSVLSDEQRQQLTSCLKILLDKACEDLGIDQRVLFP